MKKIILALLPVIMLSAPCYAKGCIKGAIVGGVAGHMMGHTGVGIAGGCIIGHHEATKHERQDRERAHRDQSYR